MQVVDRKIADEVAAQERMLKAAGMRVDRSKSAIGLAYHHLGDIDAARSAATSELFAASAEAMRRYSVVAASDKRANDAQNEANAFDVKAAAARAESERIMYEKRLKASRGMGLKQRLQLEGMALDNATKAQALQASAAAEGVDPAQVEGLAKLMADKRVPGASQAARDMMRATNNLQRLPSNMSNLVQELMRAPDEPQALRDAIRNVATSDEDLNAINAIIDYNAYMTYGRTGAQLNRMEMINAIRTGGQGVASEATRRASLERRLNELKAIESNVRGGFSEGVNRAFDRSRTAAAGNLDYSWEDAARAVGGGTAPTSGATRADGDATVAPAVPRGAGRAGGNFGGVR
jgi:hypothetical protein